MASALSEKPVPAPPPFPIARFSVEQYHRMIESGAFTEDDRLELLEGWVVRKMAKGPAHEYTTGQTDALLRERLPAGWHVRNQAPITLHESEPEPDLSVVRGSRSDYRHQHPRAGDIALVVEVSDTTLTTDRLKSRTYAAEGIPEYWIVNLAERCVEVHRRPTTSGEGYGDRKVFGQGAEIPFVVDGHDCGRVAIADLLP